MTTQINKSNIFKAAWVLVKTTALTLSQALKQAWAEAKALLSAPVATHTVIINAKGYNVAIVDNTVTIEGVTYKVETVEYNVYDKFARSNAGKQYIMHNGHRTMIEKIEPKTEPAPKTVVDKYRIWDEEEGCGGDFIKYSDGTTKTVLDY